MLVDSLPDKDCDAIFSITALHHMPLQDALAVLAAALRPGGVLAAVALPRPDLRREPLVEIVAAVGFRLLGVVFLARRLMGDKNGFAKDARSTMPVVMDPPLTTLEVAHQAAAVLPGVRGATTPVLALSSGLAEAEHPGRLTSGYRGCPPAGRHPAQGTRAMPVTGGSASHPPRMTKGSTWA